MRRRALLLIAAVAGVAVVVVLAADPQPSSTIRTQAVDSQPSSGLSTKTTTTLAPEQTLTSLPPEPVAVDLVADTDADTAPPEKGGSTESSVEGRVYVWHDGDRTRRVRLQSDLAVQAGADGETDEIVARSSVAGAASGEQALPVFRSESSGTMMTLPGGVLVLFDAEWDDAQISSFFAEQGISKSLISPMLLDNAYKIETEPGFPSLDLANRLAALDGDVISSPNWTSEAVTK